MPSESSTTASGLPAPGRSAKTSSWAKRRDLRIVYDFPGRAARATNHTCLRKPFQTMTADDGAADWIVLKFGGTSVSRRERWDAIGRLMAQRASEPARVLVVVSALSGVTNELQSIVDRRGDAGAVQAAVDALATRHLAFAAELGLAAAVLGARLAELRALAADPRREGGELGWSAEV